MRVYEITNSVNGKRYIGVTVGTVAARWKQHLRQAKSGWGAAALHAAINLYGVKAFSTREIACATDYNSLLAIEVMLIAQEGTKTPIGYNMTDGGEGIVGLVRTPEHCAKISAGQAAAWARRTPEERAAMIAKSSATNTGKTLSDEHKQKLSRALSGRKKSEEHRNAAGAAQVGIPKTGGAAKGKTVSAKTCAALSKAQTERWALRKFCLAEFGVVHRTLNLPRKHVEELQARYDAGGFEPPPIAPEQEIAA